MTPLERYIEDHCDGCSFNRVCNSEFRVACVLAAMLSRVARIEVSLDRLTRRERK